MMCGSYSIIVITLIDIEYIQPKAPLSKGSLIYFTSLSSRGKIIPFLFKKECIPYLITSLVWDLGILEESSC